MRQVTRGFTLVELMITLAILTILLGIALPSFQSMIASQKIKTAAADLQSSLLLARSEALKRNANVTLAPAATGQWNRGWTLSALATTLHSNGPVKGIPITGPATVVFQGSGRLTRTSTNSTFRLSSDETSDVRCVGIDLSGIARVTTSGC